MTTPNSNIRSIAVIGGTGNLGGSLARRWARAGLRIHIGSREAAKAQAAAQELAASLPGITVSGHANREAAEIAEIVVLAVPFAHQRPVLEDIRGVLNGKILVDTTVPLVPPKVMRVQLPKEGCAALITQQIVGAEVPVVSAFQNVDANALATDAQLDCDVLVTGDQPEARSVVIELAAQAGLRAWHAGPLANSAAMEALTSVLIFMNKQAKGGHAGIRITGIGAPKV